MKNNIYLMYMNKNDIDHLDAIIIKLNDQVGQMGNNLIEKQIELDYLKKVIEQLEKINKLLIDQLNKKPKKDMLFY